MPKPHPLVKSDILTPEAPVAANNGATATATATPTPKVEQDVDALAKEMGELLEDLDIDHVDLSMPVIYEEELAGQQRRVLVSEANTYRWAMAANKLVNPDRYRELEKTYKVTLWQIALIDRRFPAAKAISIAIMNEAAENDRSKRAVRKA